MKKILFLFLINFIIVTDVLSNESKSEQKDNTWTSRKISLGVGFGFNECLFREYNGGILYPCPSNIYANEISLNIWPIRGWQLTVGSGLYSRPFLQDFSEFFTLIFLNALTGLSLSYDNFRWYFLGGIHIVMDPFYYGPQLSTGIDLLFWKVITIGLKINGKYLLDSSVKGNRMEISEGFHLSVNDTHAELELLLTASYVFGTK